MLATPFDRALWSKWDGITYAQPKLNGWRCIATPTKDGYRLTSRSGKPITSVPHINRALNRLPTARTLDGELYVPGQPLQSTDSILSRTVNLHPNHESVEYHIFDTLSQQPQGQRLDHLLGLVLRWPLRHVSTYITLTDDEVVGYLETCLSVGYEGVVLRHGSAHYVNQPSYSLLKLKPVETDTYRIVGYEEEVSIDGVSKDSLGAVWVVGQDEQEFKVGTGFTRAQRDDLWNNRDEIVGRWIEVKYQSKSADNKPWPGVFVRLINGQKEES
jgi:DNA ligase-1